MPTGTVQPEFQYPLLGSIGCDVFAVLAALTVFAFQYPLLGSIGCDTVEAPAILVPAQVFQYPLLGSIGCDA